MSQETERRQMGAMLGIQRTNKGKNQVLVIQDQPTMIESAASLPWMYQTEKSLSKNYFSLPGGGRDRLANGSEETVAQTLNREFMEELRDATNVREEVLQQLGSAVLLLESELQYQIYPFLIAQIKTLIGPNIDVFAATSARVNFDAFSPEHQRLIESATQENKRLTNKSVSMWIEINEIYRTFYGTKNKNYYSEDTILRAQTLAAAYVWHWETMCQEGAIPIIAELNRQGYQMAKKKREMTQQRLNNGAFDSTGALKNDFSEADKKYLNLNGKQ